MITEHQKMYETRVRDVDSDCAANQQLVQWYIDLAAYTTDPTHTLEENRIFFEHWGDFGREPEDVDYIETKIANSKCLWAIPKNCDDDKVLICVHGGTYIFGNRFTHRKAYSHLAKATGCRALIVDYRCRPEYEWPIPLNDVVDVYQWLLDNGYKAENIAVTGDSAGGAVCFSLPLCIKERNLPMLAASLPVCPWVDLLATMPCYDTNKDDVLDPKEAVHANGIAMKEAGIDVEDPHVAPMFMTEEQMKGFPPIYITVGGYENLVDEAQYMAEKAFLAGIPVKLDIVEHMQHSFIQLAGACQNADGQIERFADWMKAIFKM